MMRSIPGINTARLTLRGMRPEDFDRFAEIWTLPETTRFTGGPRNRARSWEVFTQNAGHWAMAGFGQWAIVDRQSRRVVGQTGFFHGGRDLGEDFDTCPEAGWALAPEAQGRGLGLEAARAAHDWFDRVMPGPLCAMLSTDNIASRHVAARLGYRGLRETDYNGDSVLLLRRDGPPGWI